MIAIRRSDERGHFDHGWLDTRHTFSFGEYYDPERMGFGTLRVINEDRVKPGEGFGSHAHRDMEILSYVLNGTLRHHDSLGNGSIIRAGEVQILSAGAGVMHSEYNASSAEPVHFLQMWIVPAELGCRPRYEQRCFAPEERAGRLALLASPDGRGTSLTIGQDVSVYGGHLVAGEKVQHAIEPDRQVWVQVVRGTVRLCGERMLEGDGAAIWDESSLEIVAETNTEFLLVDLAKLV